MTRFHLAPRVVPFLAASALLSACGGDDQQGKDSGGQEASALGRAGIFTTPESDPASVQVQPDSARTASALISSDGGTLTATGADGTQFILSIPKDALLDAEQITLSPVVSLGGLPEDASSVAAAELGPDGLLLLQPGTLEIRTSTPVDRTRAFPIAWSGGGEDLHLHPITPRVEAIRFEVTHFSGFGIANGSDAAMSAIQKKEPQRCGERYFREIAQALGERRRAALMGDESGMAEIVSRLVELSRSYMRDVIQPIIAGIKNDDALLPCALSDIVLFERTLRLLAGDDVVEKEFSQPLENAWMEIFKATGAAFTRSSERCAKNQSPYYQFQRMVASARFLLNSGLPELLPENHVAMIEACGGSIEYLVDVEGTLDNVYAMQGRGSDFSSSSTRIKASGLNAVFDKQRARQGGTPTFTSVKVPLEATVTAVPRKACPDQARVKPGSTVSVTVTPVLNPRIGKLVCEGGKARCERTDVNPGEMVTLAPHVVEETLLHTLTSKGCTPSGYWGEWMMMWEGGQSTGAFEPFQVRGTGQATVVRKGTGKRGYLNLPAIQSATATIKTKVTAKRK